MDVVLEGTATQVTSEAALQHIAEAYRIQVRLARHRDRWRLRRPLRRAHGPAPPPYLPYEITPSTVFAFGTADEYGGRTTRYRF